MAVGAAPSEGAINTILAQLSVNLRNAMDAIRYQNVYISGLGTVGLEAAGFSAADAATVLQMMGYMNNVAAVYYGTGTQATASDFDAALSVLWGGQ